ncbi:MAG: GNAT family N-acetyltransferase [bacterium]
MAISINKQKYRDFCKTENDLPIFSQDWWLDTVCGPDNWNVIVIENGNNIIATMPYYQKVKFGLNCLIMPKLTQNLGPYIKYPPGQKYSTRLSYQKKILNQIIEQLPKYHHFSQSFHYMITNWLPFYWKGFTQTTRFTYTIDLSQGLETLWENVDKSYRNKISKASKILSVRDDLPIEDFYTVNSKVYQRQNIKNRYTLNFVKKLDAILVEKNCRKIFYTVDNMNRIHSAAYLVWDKRSSYMLMSGADPILRQSGSGTLLNWEAIKFSCIKLDLRCFDFEGSMIEGVENRCRSFGAIQTPYSHIQKTLSKLMLLKRALNQIMRSY